MSSELESLMIAIIMQEDVQLKWWPLYWSQYIEGAQVSLTLDVRGRGRAVTVLGGGGGGHPPILQAMPTFTCK